MAEIRGLIRNPKKKRKGKLKQLMEDTKIEGKDHLGEIYLNELRNSKLIGDTKNIERAKILGLIK